MIVAPKNKRRSARPDPDATAHDVGDDSSPTVDTFEVRSVGHVAIPSHSAARTMWSRVKRREKLECCAVGHGGVRRGVAERPFGGARKLRIGESMGSSSEEL
jgi:hypothetical protein